MAQTEVKTIQQKDTIRTPVRKSENTEVKLDLNENSLSSSLSSSQTTSRNHHVSFPVDPCSKNTSVSAFPDKKSQSLFNLSFSSREKIVYNRPPDGGWGWAVVFASFMINLIADGISLSFGVLFVDLLETFGESKSKTAWVGSLFLSIPLLTGPIASALTDHFGCRKTAIAGSILSAIGFVLGSYSTKIEHLFFAFSIAGFGIALCTVTSIVAVAFYFERKRSLATGLSVSGSGFGTFLFAPFTIYLLDIFGWRKTLLVLAAIFFTIVFFAMLIRDIDIDEFESDDDDDDEDDVEDDEDDDNDNDNDNYNDNDNNRFNNRINNRFNNNQSKSDIDSGSDIDSDELDSIPEGDEDAENDDSRGFSQRSSNDSSAKLNRKLIFSKSTRIRHISECEKSHEALPRACASLINIPTFIKESSCNSGGIVQSGTENAKNQNLDSQESKIDFASKTNNTSELTFRRGGYLHNLIRYYPHLLSLFLQPCNGDGSNDLTTKSVLSTTCNAFEATKDAKMLSIKKSIDEQDQRPIKHSSLQPNDVFCSSLINESVSIIVPSARPSKNDLLNYSKHHRHRVNRFVRNRHRHRMHQTHLQHDIAGGDNCLNNLRLQRGSLTYRSAMLVISKYKLKASSCPDIYRTSMLTINENKQASFFENMKKLFSNMVDFSSLKNIPFLIFCLSNFILYACIDIPYVYLPDQAISSGSFDKETASLLISIIGVFNTPGIVLTGYIGDKSYLDASMIYAIFTIVSGMALTALPLTKNRFILSALTAVYGFAISANYSLVSVILVELISLDSFTQAYGLLLLLQGIASLLGPPVVGLFYDISGAYDLAFYLTGICIFFSGLMVIPIIKKQNCFLWTRKITRSGSLSSLTFRPLSFIKHAQNSNYKTKKHSKLVTEKLNDSSKVSSLINSKNGDISNVDL